MKLSVSIFLTSSLAAVSAFVPNTAYHQARTLLPTTATKASKVDPMDYVSYYTNDDDSRLPSVLPAGEWNFDPLGFSKVNSLNSFGLTKFFMRESEIKHGRLAMLAAFGWPVAELLDRPLAKVFGMQPIVDDAGRSPSILNGGLDKVSPIFWVSILGAAFVIDMIQINKANADDPEYFPGNIGWDPLGLYPKDEAGQKAMQAKEIRNGRLAMIAITAFAAQEYVTSLGVVEETPVFFKPFFGLF
jgi:hypothetical protein